MNEMGACSQTISRAVGHCKQSLHTHEIPFDTLMNYQLFKTSPIQLLHGKHTKNII